MNSVPANPSQDGRELAGADLLRFCRLIYAIAIAVFAVLLLRHHYTIITMPIPLDLYEGTMPLITGIFARGDNPYTLAYQPQAMDVYPPLYNMLVASLTGIFPNSLVLHRAVSAVFIVATCLLFGLTTWRQGRDPLHATAAVFAVYAGLVFYSTPVASTNGLGVFLFSMSVAVPWLGRFSVASLAASCVLGLLSFYAKQYFMLGIAIVCLYVFLYVSVARALLLGTAFATALLLSLVLVQLSSPYFLDNTLFANLVAARALNTWSMVWQQYTEFTRIYAGYLLLSLLLMAGVARQRATSAGLRGVRARFAGRDWSWHGPLLAQRADYFWFAFFWSTLAVAMTMGQNPGNYMTYLFQLMSPFLLVAVFASLSRVRRVRWWTLVLVLYSFYQAWLFLPRDFHYDAANWRRMEALVRDADQVLASQMLVMMLLDNHKVVHQDGHTFYFPLAAGKPALFQQRGGQPDVETVWASYIAELYRKIEHGEFDLVVVSPWEMRGIFDRHPPPQGGMDGRSFLKEHYYVSETIPLSMTNRQGGGTWDLMVWKPRRPAS